MNQLLHIDLTGPQGIPVPHGFTLRNVGTDIVMSGKVPDNERYRDRLVAITFRTRNNGELSWQCHISQTYEYQTTKYAGAPSHRWAYTGKWAKGKSLDRTMDLDACFIWIMISRMSHLR